MTNEEMIKRINEIDEERERLKQEKGKYLRELETVKLKIQSTPRIVQYRIICNKVLEGNNSEIKLETLNSINHIDELEKFTINQLGDSKEVREELNKIRNN